MAIDRPCTGCTRGTVSIWRRMLRAGLPALLLSGSAAQTQKLARQGTSEFEVASVKRMTGVPASLPIGGDISSVSLAATGFPITKGGPGTSTPERIHYVNATLMSLITKAYGIHADQVHGPDRLTSDKYLLDAIVPRGATLEQFRQMLQSLLLKRFRLAFRWEERDFKVYHLVIGAGGPKLRPSKVGDPDDDQDEMALASTKLTPTLDDHGCPILPLVRRGVAGRSGGSNCVTFVGYSMSELAASLEDYIGTETTTTDFAHITRAHVIDDTGLAGRFDFNLNYNRLYFLAMAPGFPSPPNFRNSTTPSDSIFKVVQAQLGLRLDRTTSKLKSMLIQHVEADPTEN